ncbi:MAG: O-antigen ligase family protein [Gaiellaceae bacterium]
MTRSRRTVVVAVAVAALVTAANASQGAYFSQSWGWVALAFLIPATLALILGVAEVPGPLRIAFAALFTALGVWIALSALWSLSPAGSIREVERMLVYVALALALALVLRRGDAAGLTGGLLVGVVAVSSYSLATRLFQDVFDTYDDPDLPYRLSEPIGYWNSLGLFAVMGVLLAIGLTAHGRRSSIAALAAAALPVLACTVYFTFSRGAWAALVIGLAAMVVADARRLRLLWTALVVSLAPVLAVGVASRQAALTTEDAPAAAAAAVTQGHRLAVWLVGLSVMSAALALGARLVSERLPASRFVRRVVDVVLACAVVAALVSGIAAVGGPSSVVGELRERFQTEVTVRDPNNLNERLFSLYGTFRAEHIRVAWDAATNRPIVGNGAGTFEYFWYVERPMVFDVRDAHSLYAEMLAEVGIVGLALLLLALIVPVVAAARARRSRVAPAAFGVFAAWAAHSAMDWHWEIVGVTLTALLAAGACMLAAERHRGALLRDHARRPLLAGSIGLSVVAVVSLVGNQALFAGRDAVRSKEWREARDHARRAEALLPWSFEPMVVRGDAAAGLGDRAGAIAAYRDATTRDSENWVAWLRLAQVSRGAERASAYARVRALNPLEENLPGETRKTEP